MPRVKGGYTTRRRRKAVLKLAKGYVGSKHTIYRTANEAVMRAMQYAYRDRKQKKRDFRKLWIQRINAAAKENGLKYSLFICGLSRAGVEVNRKMLADLAVNDPKAFTEFVEIAKKGLTMPSVKLTEKVVVLQTESKAAKAAKADVAQEAPKATKTVKAPKTVKVETPKTEVAVEATVDYNKMTVAELKVIAKEKGITGISAMKKADLVAALTK
ncbi:MAG TPA: 50S ribosomal protein L20 [Acholeplasmatales bacterium]|nr:50S ribosomal protein L20 [Clostridium sp. CAG:307]HCS24992.1 50S ribosomal protein L20 [Acholeplasmatales bacterium]